MIDLAKKSGVATLQTLWNQQCTAQNVQAMIRAVGQRCRSGDTFVFYYTGHGDELPNNDGQAMGEEEDMDQCFCLVDANGITDGPQPDLNFRSAVWLRDDDFANTILTYVPDSAQILVLCDCCHSGTICDFTDDSLWAKRRKRAMSISGCQDKQTSAGTGKGGMFTRALTKSIQDMVDSGAHSYNVSTVYNRTLEHYAQDKQPGHSQSISIHGSIIWPANVAWPLQPRGPYVSPANMQYRGM